ncbi:MAG TPA: carbon starvation CstA family protein [Pseudomonadales bacterium]|nr:carbon starvation CstA family protein [Pseudomonadales bacterium]HMY96368.1 carbon starvation CstA family protein [Pseudomonadales bacterium]HNL24119.1 carbon starvation CstA family protein [Pseudomonadales bacterium]
MIKNKIYKNLFWIAVAVVGAFAFGGLALHRGESINALWLIVAALCIYAIGYRFYSAWIATRVLMLDETRLTPAERLKNGRDFMPTQKWVLFGHHFAAIAGPGPLVGPTLAAQFGYLPGTLWILIGSLLCGCVQDMVILFCSTRRDGRSLGQMARDELGAVAGVAALIGTFMILVILIAVLGLVVVNAMKHSPWATATVAATIPIAMLVGLYMHGLRPGKVLEGSLIGVALLLFSVIGGGWIDQLPAVRGYFDWNGPDLAWAVIIYGFAAAVLPVWLLLAPRDYLSTFLKLGTVFMLAIAVVFLAPEIKMPAVTRFIDGSGPIFGGTLFPFVFITIACGAISGFHSLVASGTTPKMIENEKQIRLVGYGSMMLESFVALMAMIAATMLDPGVYFAINTAAGVVGNTPAAAVATISSWGFPVTVEQMQNLAQQMGESSLFGRTGGAPSLAVGMATIFNSAFGSNLLALWYHFAIMFEAVFILTTLDAGTRVGRFMLQDLLGNLWKPLGRTSWTPSVLLSSALVVAAWGYFLRVGVLDPNGGINILWPLFGISNQILAAIALCVATGILVKSGRVRYAWVTGLPLTWLTLITSSAAWEKIMSADPRIGFFAAANDMAGKLAAGLLSPERAAVAPQLILNQRIDGYLTLFFALLLWVILLDMLRVVWRVLSQRRVPPSTETVYQARTGAG